MFSHTVRLRTVGMTLNLIPIGGAVLEQAGHHTNKYHRV